MSWGFGKSRTAPATPSQIKYATDLLRKLGYDRDRYDLENMTKAEISELITELKQELWDLR